MPYPPRQIPDAPVPISMIPQAETLSGTDIVVVVQPLNAPGQKVRTMTLSQLAAFIAAGELGEIVFVNKYEKPKEPPKPEKVTKLTVEKVWDDKNDKFGDRPDSVTVVLYANGEKFGRAVLSEENDWSYTFKDLPKYDSKGKEIVFSVEEVYISPEWRAEYGEIIFDGNRFETTVINVYNFGYILPETGGGGNIISITGGIVLLVTGSGLIYRQKFKKRRKEDDSS
jgi:LPXTG-motif cell wall-anchored protein